MAILFYYVRECGSERECYAALLGADYSPPRQGKGEAFTVEKPKQGDLFGSGGPKVKERYADDIRKVYTHYQRYHPRARMKPGNKEWAAVRDRLGEGYSVDDICKAIDGIHTSPWHRGENTEKRKWLGLELICRSASNVQRFAEMSEENPNAMYDGTAHTGGKVDL